MVNIDTEYFRDYKCCGVIFFSQSSTVGIVGTTGTGLEYCRLHETGPFLGSHVSRHPPRGVFDGPSGSPGTVTVVDVVCVRGALSARVDAADRGGSRRGVWAWVQRLSGSSSRKDGVRESDSVGVTVRFDPGDAGEDQYSTVSINRRVSKGRYPRLCREGGAGVTVARTV